MKEFRRMSGPEFDGVGVFDQGRFEEIYFRSGGRLYAYLGGLVPDLHYEGSGLTEGGLRLLRASGKSISDEIIPYVVPPKVIEMLGL